MKRLKKACQSALQLLSGKAAYDWGYAKELHCCCQLSKYIYLNGQLLHHTDDDTTRRIYLHVTKNKKREAAQKFSELMSGL